MGQAKLVSHEERLEAVSRAKLREAVDPSTRDLLNGPGGEGSYTLGQEVRCTYEEKDPLKPIGGHTKKFPCHDAKGKRLKVKYDPSTNPEVVGEVLGTRLFWALGFFAERMYSVKIVCANCPEDPFKADAKAPRGTRTFETATLQNRLPGEELSETEGEGWRLKDLDAVDPARGGASKAEVDALKLLIVLVHHGDNTANQQRLLCAPEDKKCKSPLMYVTDLGGTFGGRENSTSYRLWSRRKVWRDAAACVADFEGTDSSFRDPVISEEGRALLAGLLEKLSDKQIVDLFKGARVEALAKFEPAVVGKDGKGRRVNAEDWAQAFKKKREEISKAKCPR
jgi:hypothetical protein